MTVWKGRTGTSDILIWHGCQIILGKYLLSSSFPQVKNSPHLSGVSGLATPIFIHLSKLPGKILCNVVAYVKKFTILFLTLVRKCPKKDHKSCCFSSQPVAPPFALVAASGLSGRL